MKKSPLKKRRSSRRVAILAVMRVLLSATAFAVEPPHHDQQILETLTQMRMRQEQEENVVRIIQQPVVISQDACSPSEQARQRIRDLGGKDGKQFGTVSVEAGHGDVSIDGNSGEINNSVSVQVVAPNDRKCF